MNPVGPAGSAGSIQQIIAMREQVLERSKLLQELRQGAPDGANGTQTANGVQGTGSAGPAASFTDTLQGALGSVNAAQKNSSRITEAYERGEVTDVAKVMLARQESSVAFEATLQVRNKLLSAYQEIMRMGV